jgi:hypothetical protein
MQPPKFLGTKGTYTVVRWAVIDTRQRPSGNCRQVVAGELQGPAARLAICQGERETGYYLFGCDAAWNTKTDTWHETLEGAMGQAEFEYAGVTATWNVM